MKIMKHKVYFPTKPTYCEVTEYGKAPYWVRVWGVIITIWFSANQTNSILSQFSESLGIVQAK